MKTIDVKSVVEQVIRSEWDAFEREHPNLARIVDETLLVQAAGEVLANDPEYRAAMARVQALTAAAELAERVVHRVVRRWLGQLL